MRLDRIADKFDVTQEEIIGYANTKFMKIYNLPPRGSKKDRFFVSAQNGDRIKKHFSLKLKTNTLKEKEIVL